MQTLNGIDSKFRLAILVARRAKQLIGGARRKIEIKSDNPLTVAMEEFRQGKIDFNVLNEEENLFAMVDGENLEAPAAAANGSEGEEDADEPESIEEIEEKAEADSES